MLSCSMSHYDKFLLVTMLGQNKKIAKKLTFCIIFVFFVSFSVYDKQMTNHFFPFFISLTNDKNIKPFSLFCSFFGTNHNYFGLCLWFATLFTNNAFNYIFSSIFCHFCVGFTKFTIMTKILSINVFVIYLTS